MLVIAHAGHWIVQVLYVAPLLAFFVILVRAKLRERREHAELAPDAEAGGAGPARHER